MSAITPNPLTKMTDEKDDILFQQGLAIYDETLKPLLEPAYNQQYVAIQVGSGEHAIRLLAGQMATGQRK